MTDQQLQQMVEILSLNVFQKPFLHRAVFNKRLKTTGGRYLLCDHSIEINPRVYELYGLEELKGVVQHELCHYHLHLAGRGYRHQDNDFKQLLQDTKSPRYCRPLAIQRALSTKRYLYECLECSTQFVRKKKMNPTRYRCGACRGMIQQVTETIVE